MDSYALDRGSFISFGIPRKQPKDIRQTVQIPDTLRIDIFRAVSQGDHPAFGPTANRPGHIKGSPVQSVPRSRPMFVRNVVILLQVVDYSR